jgi:hypothetical protein
VLQESSKLPGGQDSQVPAHPRTWRKTEGIQGWEGPGEGGAHQHTGWTLYSVQKIGQAFQQDKKRKL